MRQSQRDAQRAGEGGKDRDSETEKESTTFIFCPLPRATSGTVPKRFPSLLPPLTGFSSLLAAEVPAGMLERSRLEEEDAGWVGVAWHWLLRAGDAQGRAGLSSDHTGLSGGLSLSTDFQNVRVPTSPIFMWACGGPRYVPTYPQ